MSDKQPETTSQPKKKAPKKSKKAKAKSKDFVKCTKAESIRRVTQVATFLSEGFTRAEISRKIDFQVGMRQLDQYIAMAHKELREINQVALGDNIAYITKQLWKVFREALKHSDKIAALKEIARIKGIGTTNVKLTVEDKRELAGLSDEELDAFYNAGA